MRVRAAAGQAERSTPFSVASAWRVAMRGYALLRFGAVGCALGFGLGCSSRPRSGAVGRLGGSCPQSPEVRIRGALGFIGLEAERAPVLPASVAITGATFTLSCPPRQIEAIVLRPRLDSIVALSVWIRKDCRRTDLIACLDQPLGPACPFPWSVKARCILISMGMLVGSSALLGFGLGLRLPSLPNWPGRARTLADRACDGYRHSGTPAMASIW